jgi:hypothetical protein
LVGSSSSSTSAGCSISRAINTRARSPAGEAAHRLIQVLAVKRNLAAHEAT